MLTIRAPQLQMFCDDRVRLFLDQLTSYIASEYPAQARALGPDGVRAFVERSVQAAAAMGITREGSVGALTELWLVYGDRLERAPDREWAHNILAHKELPDYVKVEAVQNRLQEKTGGRRLVVFAAPP